MYDNCKNDLKFQSFRVHRTAPFLSEVQDKNCRSLDAKASEQVIILHIYNYFYLPDMLNFVLKLPLPCQQHGGDKRVSRQANKIFIKEGISVNPLKFATI